MEKLSNQRLCHANATSLDDSLPGKPLHLLRGKAEQPTVDFFIVCAERSTVPLDRSRRLGEFGYKTGHGHHPDSLDLCGQDHFSRTVLHIIDNVNDRVAGPGGNMCLL